MTDETNNAEVFKLLAPYLAATVVATLTAGVVLLKVLGMGTVGAGVGVVSFDVIKYTNAQRAVASTFLKRDADIGHANELLLDLPKRTRDAISEVAGDGTLVVVKQAVVQGQTMDITDQVLKKLGLPTDVPTADATSYSLDMAPTMLPFARQPGKATAPSAPSARPQALP